MAARGLMDNPALFAGYSKTPWSAVERFLYHNMTLGPLPHHLTIHHIGEMMANILTRKERSDMIESSSNIVELLDWLDRICFLTREGDSCCGESVIAREK